MLFRLTGALTRAALVVFLIAVPSILLPGGTLDSAQIVAIVAVFAGLFTVVEYSASSPSLIEFRDARPFNRMRFVTVFATVLSLSIIFRGYEQPSTITNFVHYAGSLFGGLADFPFSPVRLMVAILQQDTTAQIDEQLWDAVGLSYVISLSSVAWFVLLLQLKRWPRPNETFNVWINLPTFDPVSGGDVVKRMRRDGHINMLLGILLPFLIPMIVKLADILGVPLNLSDPQTLIWTVTAWTFLPAGVFMRGIALKRIAKLIHTQRKRAYERAETKDMLPTW